VTVVRGTGQIFLAAAILLILIALAMNLPKIIDILRAVL
jgi:hypothetical protein